MRKVIKAFLMTLLFYLLQVCAMQHLKIYESAGTGHDYKQLIPLTPATSFSMKFLKTELEEYQYKIEPLRQRSLSSA